MSQIFVSYSRVDAAFVELFIRRLERAFPDLKILRDQAPHGLIGGGNRWSDILSAIAGSDVFIYILSNESVNSLYCRAEFNEARRLQKRIVTVQARDKTELTDDLDDFQFIDMKDGVDAPDAFPSLVAALRLRLEEAKKYRNARPLWKPATPKPQQEARVSHAADASDVETPPQEKSTAEQEALRLTRSGVRWQIISVVLSMILGVAALALTAVQLLRDTTPTPFAPVSTHSVSAPPPSSLLATLSPTLSFEQSQTAQMQLTASTADPLQEALPPFTRNIDWKPIERDFNGVTMVLVPAGCFTMGSNDYDGEQPAHEQCFDEPFWIDKYEVTNGQFAEFGGQAGRNSNWTGTDLPRERITWFEADAFCELRGARLPTEREWEYAARGPDGLAYPWGNAFVADDAVYRSNSGSRTASVGSRPSGASWVGALDLSGNVWEWTSSLSKSYLYDATDGREADTGERADVRRVIRGGWWGSDPFDLRAAYRLWGGPNLEGYFGGFRCARSKSVF